MLLGLGSVNSMVISILPLKKARGNTTGPFHINIKGSEGDALLKELRSGGSSPKVIFFLL